MIDLLLPSTDLGVAIQLGVVLAFGALAIYATRDRRDWRLVAVGLVLFTLGLFGLRALH